MKPVCVRPVTLSCMVGFEKKMVQMIFMTSRCVANKIYVASLKANVIVRTLTLLTDYNESLLYPAYNFVLHDGISK